MKKFFIATLFFISSLLAQNEFAVNTFTDSSQRAPIIATDQNGNFVVVWQSLNQVSANSGYDIYMQKFNANDQKISGEVLVNNLITSGEQERAAIALSPQGKGIIVWASFIDNTNLYDIKGRMFDFNSSTMADEFLINTTRANSQSNPDVAVNDNGEFVVVWDSWNQDASDRGVFAQKYSSTGSTIGSEFLVNQFQNYSQAKPKTEFITNNKYAVVWESFNQETGSNVGYGMFGRIFEFTGNTNTDEFQINTHVTDYQWFGELCAIDDTSFAVVWCSWEQDGDDGGIFIQRFNLNGNKLGAESQVNKSTAQYQWLPRVKKLSGKNLAVVWSSWKQDGDREGIYCAFINEFNNRISFETKVNATTVSYQWEPDFIIKNNEEILVVWASNNQVGTDYDIIARKVKPQIAEKVINPNSYSHANGKTTSKMIVHVVDSSQTNGHQYEVSFDTISSSKYFAHVKDLNTNQFKVQNFPIDKGTGIFYLTSVFDGVAVEFIPDFKLELDVVNSKFKKNSSTNISFSLSLPASGQKLLAPIDVVFIWGNTDTLPSGQYANPLDTALGINGQKNVLIPFKAMNITDGGKLTILIKENNATKNFKWDPTEDIVFITPPPYQVTAFNTHAQINSVAPTGTIVMPSAGDSHFVFTKRPITPGDKFNFTTSANLIIAEDDERFIINTFKLFQNYPNPFNPSTVISYQLSVSSNVVLKIFDVLGNEVATLINNEWKEAGYHNYQLSPDASGFNYQLSSGIYFYQLRAGSFSAVKKFILLK